MLETLFGLLLTLLVCCLVVAVARYILSLLPFDPPIKNFILGIVCVLLLIFALQRHGLLGAVGWIVVLY